MTDWGAERVKGPDILAGTSTLPRSLSQGQRWGPSETVATDKRQATAEDREVG